MLSLSDSEIPLTTEFASVCLLLSQSGDILPDPCKEEEESNVLLLFLFYYYRMWVLLPLHIKIMEMFFHSDLLVVWMMIQ